MIWQNVSVIHVIILLADSILGSHLTWWSSHYNVAGDSVVMCLYIHRESVQLFELST